MTKLSEYLHTAEAAEYLGVHHNTVAEAYRVLSDEGWLDLRRRTDCGSNL